MKSITKILFLLGLVALNAQADGAYRTEEAGIWSRPWSVLARMSSDERRAMRERWDTLLPDERDYLRQQFRDRVQSLPPEQREGQRREIMNLWRDRSGEEYGGRWQGEDERPRDGYGRGYERREDRYERSDRERGSRRDR